MNCDKCNTPVPEDNDATIVEALASGCPGIVLLNQSRHFLPVLDESGNVICEGSPSRAQYIEGQPKDRRGFPYAEENEAFWRRGYSLVKGEM